MRWPSAAPLAALLLAAGCDLGRSRPATTPEMDRALEATRAVRAMASDSGHQPRPGTILEAKVRAAARKAALCDDYAEALVHLLADAGLGDRSRIRFVCFTALPLDCHTVVELQTRPDGPWMMLDPTFALAIAIGDRFAGVEDLAALVRSNAWSQAEVVALGERTAADLEGYYLDYPLLFLNPVGRDDPAGTPLAPASPLPYLEPAALPAADERGVFVAACAPPGAQAPTAAPGAAARTSLVVDGSQRTLDCLPPFGLSSAFWATEVDRAGASAPSAVHRVPSGGAPSARVRGGG